MRVASAAKPGFTDWRNQPRSFQSHFVCEDGSDRWFFTVYSPPDDDSLAELRYGLTDEAAKLNLNAAQTTNFSGIPALTAQHIAALHEVIHGNDLPRTGEAAPEFSPGLARPSVVHHGPLVTLQAILLIPGFTPSLLSGKDANMNLQ